VWTFDKYFTDCQVNIAKLPVQLMICGGNHSRELFYLINTKYFHNRPHWYPNNLGKFDTSASGLIQVVRAKTPGLQVVLHENFSSPVSAARVKSL